MPGRLLNAPSCIVSPSGLALILLLLTGWLHCPSESSAQSPAPTPFAAPDLNIRTGGSVSAIARQADGKWVVAGPFFVVQGQERRTLARLNTDGSLDPGFAPVIEGGAVQTLVASADAIYLAGTFSSVNGVARSGLARIGLDGQLDPNWQVNVARGSVKALDLAGNGWLWIGGEFGSVNGESRRFLARVDAASGALGTSSHPDWGNIAQIIAAPTGIHVRPTGLSRIRRLNPDTGEHDSSWDPAIGVRDGFVVDGGAIYVTSNTQTRRISLASGLLDPVGTWSAVIGGQERLVGSDGTHLYTSEARRIDLAGATIAPDARLSSVRGGAPVAALAGDGELVLAGSFTDYEQSPALGVIALNTSEYGQRWEGGIEGSNPASVNAIVHLDDGSHLIGGNFVAIGNHVRRGLARLLPDGSLDPAWKADLDQVGQSTAASAGRPSVSHIAVAEDKVYVSGAFNRVEGVTRPGLAKLSLSGQLVATFDPLLGAGVQALLLHGGGLFLGQSVSYPISGSGGRRTNPVKLDPQTGAVVTGWISEYEPANLGVNTLLASGDSLLVAGGPEGDNSELRHGAARLNVATGARDPHFVPVLQGRTTGTELKTLLEVGDALHADGFKLLAATGQPYPGWNTALLPAQSGNASSGSITPKALGLRGGLLFVGGNGSFEINRSRRQGLYARSSVSGRLDYRWVPAADGNVSALSIDSAGRVWVGGQFRTIGGQPRRALAVLSSVAPSSSDTRLHRLSSSQGTPAYSDGIDDYLLTANPAATVFALTVIPADPNALLQLEGRTFPSHQRSHELPLAWGRNEFVLSVIADDRITRRDIRLAVDRIAEVECTASRLADMRLLDATAGPISSGGWQVSLTMQNDGPSSTVPNFSQLFSASWAHYTMGFYAVEPDGRRGAIQDSRTSTSTVGANATASRVANISPGLFVAGDEMEVVVDYFCDPDPSNNSARIRLPADDSTPPSDDATLFALTPSRGELSPAFSPGVFDYRLALGFGIDRMTLVPTATKPASQIRVNGSSVPSNATSPEIALTVGETPIMVEVTAADGESRLTYTVIVERAAAPSLSVECLGGAIGPVEDGVERHEYTLAVSNTGITVAESLRLNATTVTALDEADWSCTAPQPCTPATGNGGLVDTQLGSLAPGASVVTELTGNAPVAASFIEFHGEVAESNGFHLGSCRLDVPANGRGLFRSGFEH